jgi:hypothetical protein
MGGATSVELHNSGQQTPARRSWDGGTSCPEGYRSVRDGDPSRHNWPVRPSDVRLRRAQALASSSGADLHIARELISHKALGRSRLREIGCSNSTWDGGYKTHQLSEA